MVKEVAEMSTLNPLESLIKSNAPLVSVAMPVYNGEKYLAEAIDSVLQQTFKDFELIIIDDGSTDGSLEILKTYQKLDSRIILISRENRNLTTTLNEIIDLARGAWVARMDQDDISLPHRFERELECLEVTNADICGSWIQFFGAGDRRIWRTFHTDQAIKVDMLFKCPFAHPSVMMKTELIKKLRYDCAWEKAEDYELWTRAAISGWRMTNVQEVLLHYRRHSQQISSATVVTQKKITAQIQELYSINFAGEFGINGDDLKQFVTFGRSRGAINVIKFQEVLVGLLEQSSKETKTAVSHGVARICYRGIVQHPDAVKMLINLLEKYDVKISLWVRFQLMVVRLFRINFDTPTFNNLVKLHSFFKGVGRT
jgi:hypothetical protein